MLQEVGCKDMLNQFIAEEARRPEAALSSLPAMSAQEYSPLLPPITSPQENSPSTLPIEGRSITSLATVNDPVVIPNFPSLGNTCFVNASMQYLASFIDEKALAELKEAKPPVLPDCKPDNSESTRDRLRTEAWLRGRDSFCTLLTHLNTHQSTISMESVQAFIDYVYIYTLLSKSQSAELFFDDATSLFDEMPSSDVTLDRFIEMQRPRLRQQDSTEFSFCIQDMFSLDNLPSLKETARFTYKQTTNIELEKGVCISATRKEDHNTTLSLDLALPPNIHRGMPEGDLGDALAEALNNDSREQLVEEREAKQAYLDAGKTFPSTYNEKLERTCHLATSLCVPSSFERLLIRLGVFQYDYQSGRPLKRSDEATHLVAKSNGFISLAGILEYEKLLEDEAERTSIHIAKNFGEITAILCHQGSAACNGHYMTLRKINETWYIFDDQESSNGSTLEAYLEVKCSRSRSHDCFKGFDGVAHFLKRFAAPYAVVLNIKSLPSGSMEREKIQYNSTLAAIESLYL